MYQELIRGELTEAAATLDNFLKDENNIDAIRRLLSCWLILLKRAAK